MSRRNHAKRSAELLEYLAKAQHDNQQRERQLATQLAALSEKKAELRAERRQLENLLHDALAQDSLVDLESLKQSPAMPAFEGEAPDRRLYLPPPLSRADALKPWKKKAYQAALKKANDSYRRDQAAYDQAEIEHTYRLATEGQAAAEHNQAIDQITRAFAKGEPEAIVRYYKLALEASAYPSGFPSMVELEYAAESAELRIQRALPAYDVIPGIETYVFDRDTREIAPRFMPQAQRQELYAATLARICLRTLHEVFSADRANRLKRIVFHGHVEGINPSTGLRGRVVLLALAATWRQFAGLDLHNVDPLVCLRGMKANISAEPHALLPVPLKPMADKPAQARADGAQHEERIDKLEGSLKAQSRENAQLRKTLAEKEKRISLSDRRLESLQQQLADTVPALREAQERNSALSSEVQAQRLYIAVLEGKVKALSQEPPADETASVDPLEDTQPIAALDEADDETPLVADELFAPIAEEEGPEHGADLPIPPPEPAATTESASPAPAAGLQAEAAVSLGSLLRGEEPSDATPPELTERPADTPDDLLTDLPELVTIMGAAGSETSRLITTMAEQGWACSHGSLEASFKQDEAFTFANNIIDLINDRANELIDHPLIIEEAGQWVIEEEFRDEIEHILQHQDYRKTPPTD